MRATIDGHQYRVRFGHDQGKVHARGCGVTYCSILETVPKTDPVPAVDAENGRPKRDEEVVVATGLALCAYTDSFVKDVGRKVALNYALRNGKFDKATRRAFWHAYFERS